MNELLKNLTEAVGVSGEEKEVRLLIRDLIADHVDEWHVDAMGSLIALKKGTGAVDLRDTYRYSVLGRASGSRR